MAEYFITESMLRIPNMDLTRTQQVVTFTSFQDSVEVKDHTHLWKYVPMLEPDMHKEIIIILSFEHFSYKTFVVFVTYKKYFLKFAKTVSLSITHF